jgi:hypothetical protein
MGAKSRRIKEEAAAVVLVVDSGPLSLYANLSEASWPKAIVCLLKKRIKRMPLAWGLVERFTAKNLRLIIDTVPKARLLLDLLCWCAAVNRKL